MFKFSHQIGFKLHCAPVSNPNLINLFYNKMTIPKILFQLFLHRFPFMSIITSYLHILYALIIHSIALIIQSLHCLFNHCIAYSIIALFIQSLHCLFNHCIDYSFISTYNYNTKVTSILLLFLKMTKKKCIILSNTQVNLIE